MTTQLTENTPAVGAASATAMGAIANSTSEERGRAIWANTKHNKQPQKEQHIPETSLGRPKIIQKFLGLVFCERSVYLVCRFVQRRHIAIDDPGQGAVGRLQQMKSEGFSDARR